MKGAIRKNLLTERIDIVKPLGWYRDSPTLTDVDVKYLLLYFEENYGLTVEKKIIDAVAVIANENRYHPVCDFLNALHWDGTERIRFCLHRFLGSDTDDYTYEALKLFLLGAISRAFKPGCKFEVMLCLVGGQGAGKSSFFRLLAVNDDWFSDDLKKLDDENVYRKMQGHWIIEMSEMIATANAKSIEEIKSFLSRQKETYKIPYETHPADRKRQCVFLYRAILSFYYFLFLYNIGCHGCQRGKSAAISRLSGFLPDNQTDNRLDNRSDNGLLFLLQPFFRKS